MNPASHKHPIYPLRTFLDSNESCQIFFKNHPKHISSIKIHVPYSPYNHSVTVKKVHHQLKKISHQSKFIKSLDLTDCQIALEFDWNRMISLIKRLRRLQSLQSLTIPHYNTGKKATQTASYWLKDAYLQKFKSVADLLADSVLLLEDLKELKFVFPMGNYKDELSGLIKSLQNRGNKIRKLSLHLVRQTLSEQSKRELIKFLEEAEGLEELELKSLMIGDLEFGDIFKEGVVRMKRLKELILDGIMMLKGRNIYLEIIEKVIGKRGFEVYSGEWGDVKGKVERKGKIDMKEAVKKNRWLKKVIRQLREQDEFKNFELLNKSRWM